MTNISSKEIRHICNLSKGHSSLHLRNCTKNMTESERERGTELNAYGSLVLLARSAF